MAEYPPLRVAIVGTGNIAGRYAESFTRRPEKVSLLGAYDIEPARTDAFVATHGGKAYRELEEAVSDPEVELVVNLTSHHAHAEITLRALEAGKHVHSEKPLAATWEEGARCVELAAERGVRLSCSPFTFMGEGQQTILKALRSGMIGKPLAAYSEMNWGHIESWHPNPEGFYRPGSGPLLDVGVYALTVMTTLLGRVRRVTGFADVVMPVRTIVKGPNAGKTFEVTTPDQVVGGLEFASGTLGRLTASFVVRGTKQASGTELHGETGSLFLSSNHDFNGTVEHFSNETRQWTPVPYVREPYKGVDWGRAVAEMADVIRTGAVQHCTGEHALHVLEICLGILQSAQDGRPVEIESPFTPPPPIE